MTRRGDGHTTKDRRTEPHDRRGPSGLDGQNTIDVGAYLERIKYRGSLAPDLRTLQALHLAHLYAVPFENFDIAARRPLVLAMDRVFDKVVHRRRGGVCYELNGLFYHLLAALGFEVRMLAAEVFFPHPLTRSELDHMLIVVDLGRRWMADVGFGGAFHEPILLDETRIQHEGERAFRVVREGAHRALWMLLPDMGWVKLYRFTLEPRSLDDYAGMCTFHQSAPESYYVKNRICALPNARGCVTLFNDGLIITEDGRRRVYPLRTEQRRIEALRRHFDIDLPDERPHPAAPPAGLLR